ncbi:hypothetical protein GCM10010383_72310 [Streptomyces lomondensis]|uniref:Uncharacterized protein n=1 Tax=Streptomyces lomondensis TaxID=68229 RepID=A0ABQ2XTN1_9ACTN|nr:hypothetical protein GCM10010383_72310 [Streptomyces lomondensis]
MSCCRADSALLPLRTPGAPGNADEAIKDKSGIPYPNAIRIPAREGKRARTTDGFQVGEDYLAWFGQLLTRAAAAGLTALSGRGQNTAQYLTARLAGSQHVALPVRASIGVQQQVERDLDDLRPELVQGGVVQGEVAQAGGTRGPDAILATAWESAL